MPVRHLPIYNITFSDSFKPITTHYKIYIVHIVHFYKYKFTFPYHKNRV